jgi:hypothetical protein
VEKESITQNAVIAAIVICIIYISLLGVYGLKYRTDQPCMSERISSYDGGSLTNSTTLGKYEMVLNRFEYDQENILNSYFEFSAESNSDNSLKYCVIDETGSCLSYGYVDKETSEYRNKINLEEEQSYLGVMCISCNGTDYFTLKKEVGGINKVYITNTSSYEDDALDYELIIEKDCSVTIKFITELYSYVLIAVGLIFFIIIGYEGFKKMLYKGW